MKFLYYEIRDKLFISFRTTITSPLYRLAIKFERKGNFQQFIIQGTVTGSNCRHIL